MFLSAFWQWKLAYKKQEFLQLLWNKLLLPFENESSNINNQPVAQFLTLNECNIASVKFGTYKHLEQGT